MSTESFRSIGVIVAPRWIGVFQSQHCRLPVIEVCEFNFSCLLLRPKVVRFDQSVTRFTWIQSLERATLAVEKKVFHKDIVDSANFLSLSLSLSHNEHFSSIKKTSPLPCYRKTLVRPFFPLTRLISRPNPRGAIKKTQNHQNWTI